MHSLGLANSYKMSFSILAKEGYISSDTSKKMGNMAGFRNIVVHDYQDVDINILKSILTNHLGDFELFYKEIISKI